MQCYKQLTPPTAVTHSLSLPFLSSSANNLIVAKTSLLQIFSVKSVITNSNIRFETPAVRVKDLTGDYNGPQTPNLNLDQNAQGIEKAHTTKLVLVAQYELSGTITAIARVKILQSKSGGEAVIVALRDAKLSMVEWDPERYSIATISIHLYEQENLRSPWEPDLAKSISCLSVDPSSRCAALKHSARHIAILPFRQAGDDLIMDDYDPEFDAQRVEPNISTSKVENEMKSKDRNPYSASFILPLLVLDPSLAHPLHFAFLYEYREPTFGILSSQFSNTVALEYERRDCLSYTVFTLDLEQRASTTLLSVNKLPIDLFAVIPLSLPVGGALLVGANELIHVDQAGKTNGVAVNSFAKNSTSFAMLDQADLGMRMEYCIIEQLSLDNRELLIILHNGELAILNFKIDGRSVSGISVRRVDQQSGGDAIPAGASCASLIGRGRIFVGSERADSVVLGWSRKSDKTKRQRSRAMAENNDLNDQPADLDEVDLEDDDDDDLYSAIKPDDMALNEASLPQSVEDGEDYIFRVHDSLQNFGLMRDVLLRKPSDQDMRVDQQSRPESSKLELVVSGGCGKAGGLTVFQREIEPNLVDRFGISDAHGVWTVCVRIISEGVSIKAMDGYKATTTEYDKYIIASRTGDTGEEYSTAYRFASTGLQEITDTDFEPDAGASIEIGTLFNGTRIVQVLAGELRTYDAGFELAQIFPMTDDATGVEPKVISANFSDPYVLLIRDDSSLMVLRVEENGDLDEVERGEGVLEDNWISGSLYEDSNDLLRLDTGGEDSEDEVGNVLLFLLSSRGGLQIFRLPNLTKPAYVADGFSFLPPFLSPDFTVRRSSARETLVEILVAEIGDAVHKSPYLIARSKDNQLYLYQPYHSPLEEQDTGLRFLKISTSYLPHIAPDIADDDEQDIAVDPANDDEQDKPKKRIRQLRAIQDLDKYSTVFMPGSSPNFVIKSASTPPYIIKLRNSPYQSLSRLNIPKCENGFVFIDGSGEAYAAKLPSESEYATGWVTRRISLGEEVQEIGYHMGQDCYALGMNRTIDFKLFEDEFRTESISEDQKFLPQIDQGSIKILDRKTWTVFDQWELDHAEVVTCIKSMSLEVSDITHERQELVVVGTSIIRGEDLPAIGRVYIFGIIDVVPEPGIPLTGRKLKLIIKEELKGAVTAVAAIGTQGCLLIAQGQKCLVRGLKEDMTTFKTLLPVAFMDMQCYVTDIKELGDTGLFLMADAIKGVWLTGYTEEPYQLQLFGKSSHHIEAIATDFLPDGKQLYIIVADADCNIHILQFDPDHPKFSGTRLLHLTSFHTGHYPSNLTLLPGIYDPSTSNYRPSRSPSPDGPLLQPPLSYQVLLTSTTGSLALITPLPSSAYRTLAALQSHLQTTLPQPLGLNPKAYRTVSGGEVGGGVVDGGVLKRWGEGGSWKRWDGGMGIAGEDGLGTVLGDLWKGAERF